MRVMLFLCCVLITLSLGVNLGGCASGNKHSGGTVHKQNESWNFGQPRKVKQNDKFITESGRGSSVSSVKRIEEKHSPNEKESETGQSVDSSAKTKSSKKKSAPPPPPPTY